MDWDHQDLDAVDFDRLVDRTGTASLKWDRYGSDVLPLWVADMDFAAPPPVVAAVEEFAAHGVYGYTRVPRSLEQAVRDFLPAATAGRSTRSGWSSCRVSCRRSTWCAARTPPRERPS